MRPGGRGRLPAPGSHRSERAQLRHSAPRTMESLRWRAPASRRFGRLPASCRACVETACGPMSMPSVRPTAHDPVRRFPPPGSVGPVPRLRRYYQRTPTSRRPSRRTSSPSLGGTTGRPVRSRGGGPSLGPGRTCMAAVRVPRLRWRRRDLPGSWATHRLHAPLYDPGGTSGTRPISVPAVLPSAPVTASASTITTISGLNHAACKAPCVRFAAGVAPGPRNTRFRLAGQPWPGQVFHLLGRKEGFRHVNPWLPPPPSFAWRKTGTSAHRCGRGRPRTICGRGRPRTAWDEACAYPEGAHAPPFPPLSMASSTRGGDSGSSVIRMPMAWLTALPTAARGATMGVSPQPRTP